MCRISFHAKILASRYSSLFYDLIKFQMFELFSGFTALFLPLNHLILTSIPLYFWPWFGLGSALSQIITPLPLRHILAHMSTILPLFPPVKNGAGFCFRASKVPLAFRCVTTNSRRGQGYRLT